LVDVRMMALGAVASGVIDGILEAYHEAYIKGTPAEGKVFPYVPTVEPLPPVDDWIVLGIPAAAALIGHASGNDAVKDFGVGGLLYAGPMIVHRVMIRSVWLMQK